MKKILFSCLMMAAVFLTSCEKKYITNSEVEESENIKTTVLITCSTMITTLLFTYISKRRQQK
ncbi:hypothetical protein [Chryseobacterium wanjuense]